MQQLHGAVECELEVGGRGKLLPKPEFKPQLASPKSSTLTTLLHHFLESEMDYDIKVTYIQKASMH